MYLGLQHRSSSSLLSLARKTKEWVCFLKNLFLYRMTTGSPGSLHTRSSNIPIHAQILFCSEGPCDWSVSQTQVLSPRIPSTCSVQFPFAVRAHVAEGAADTEQETPPAHQWWAGTYEAQGDYIPKCRMCNVELFNRQVLNTDPWRLCRVPASFFLKKKGLPHFCVEVWLLPHYMGATVLTSDPS